jgi:hypothetical protein
VRQPAAFLGREIATSPSELDAIAADAGYAIRWSEGVR